MGITQLNFDGLNKVEEAIALIQSFEPPEGYYLADSGGKDSSVVLDLTVKSGTRFDAHYCVSPIDPKEIHQFLREHHPDTTWDYYAKGFWQTVVRKGLPTRRNRWCCEVIKEAGGLGRVSIVGNRRLEGVKRRGQTCFGKHTKKDIFYVRPIINWDENEVWEYIQTYNVPYCSLYKEGFKRLGCVLCPLATYKNRIREMERFPKITRLWRLSCDRIIERRLKQGKNKMLSGQELWDWWF